jgi:hypothetical protein
MQVCKSCRSGAFRRSGFVRGKQSYFGRIAKNYVIGDAREKYSELMKNRTIVSGRLLF